MQPRLEITTLRCSNFFALSNHANRKFSNRIERISNEFQLLKIRTNFELIFIKFFEYYLLFQINRIAKFRIERISNEFQFDSNPNLSEQVSCAIANSLLLLNAIKWTNKLIVFIYKPPSYWAADLLSLHATNNWTTQLELSASKRQINWPWFDWQAVLKIRQNKSQLW